MSRGGSRKGAGRKPGAATKRTREIADRAALSDNTPLEIMLMAMNEALQQGGAIAAFTYAKDAAPYIHPKLSAAEVTGKESGHVEICVNAPLTIEQMEDELKKRGLSHFLIEE